jgi:cysteinyl-tRNA synthetase
MSLKLYNTLTKKKQEFKPLVKGRVGMYVCGPTIYNYVHIGNLRAYIFSDILKRFFEFENYKVKEVMNLTDVDDKTIKNSIEQNLSLKEFTSKYEKAFLEDLKSMNIKTPEVMPKATEHIKEMVSLIKKLLKKGYAYKTDDGIYFSITKAKDYGKLSGIKLDELKEGASKRIGKDEYDKENANDFALWKFWAKDDGDVFWETEIGKGRPGWHIECSAMSMKYLGETFDIHAGGEDLIFPHHENEIAQSESATGKQFVKYWLHNGWVLVDAKKMSKSLKNFYKLKDITDKGYSYSDLRYFYLTKIYRQRLNFTWQELDASKTSVQRIKNIISELKDDGKINKEYLEEFRKAMNDDLNTPKALQVLWRLLRDKDASGKIQTIKKIDEVFGLKLFEEEKIEIPQKVKELMEKREKARKEKDWAIADKLRDEIKSLGYTIDDAKDGVKIKKLE